MAQASAEKLKSIKSTKKKKVASVPQNEQLASMPESHLPKETEPSVRSPNRKVGESQGKRKPHVDERELKRSGSMERKGWTSQ